MMKPGRELDASHIANLVATGVMDWELNDSVPLSWIDSQGSFRTYEETSFKRFNPWEDIAAAWEMVERVGKEYPNFVLVWWMGEEGGEWNAGFGCDYEDSWTYEASGETASQAICLAALQTRGIVIE